MAPTKSITLNHLVDEAKAEIKSAVPSTVSTTIKVISLKKFFIMSFSVWLLSVVALAVERSAFEAGVDFVDV